MVVNVGTAPQHAAWAQRQDLYARVRACSIGCSRSGHKGQCFALLSREPHMLMHAASTYARRVLGCQRML